MSRFDSIRRFKATFRVQIRFPPRPSDQRKPKNCKHLEPYAGFALIWNGECTPGR